MALASFTIDPAAEVLSGDEIVAKINDDTSTTISKAGVVTAAARPIEAGEVTNTELAVAAAKANLDALADIARGYMKTDPAVGQFPIISAQRTAAGLLEVDYDDVAIE